jgi:prepilin-type N-terminal cleavage/methylation domain-containing protein
VARVKSEKCGADPRSSAQNCGFALIELVAAVSIVVVLSAAAIPQLLNTIYLWRVRGAADGLSGLIQQARFTAEKENATIPVYAGTVETNATGAFIGINGSTWQAGDPDVPYPSGVTNAAASSAPSALNPGFTPEAAGTIFYFNPRGLPVVSSGVTYVLASGFVFYIADAHNDWVAVSVSAAGRSRVWLWNGTAWQ